MSRSARQETPAGRTPTLEWQQNDLVPATGSTLIITKQSEEKPVKECTACEKESNEAIGNSKTLFDATNEVQIEVIYEGIVEGGMPTDGDIVQVSRRLCTLLLRKSKSNKSIAKFTNCAFFIRLAVSTDSLQPETWQLRGHPRIQQGAVGWQSVRVRAGSWRRH
jgi:hypothetical protein